MHVTKLVVAAAALIAVGCGRGSDTMTKKPARDAGVTEDPDRPGRLTLTLHEDRSEHSLDSNSSSRTWSVRGHRLTYAESHSGAYAGPSVADDAVVHDADLDHLADVLASQGLLADQTVTVADSEHGSLRYRLEVTLDDVTTTVELSGGQEVWEHPIRNRIIAVTTALSRLLAGAHVGSLEISLSVHRPDTEVYYELLGEKLDVSVVRVGEVDTAKNRYANHVISAKELARLTAVVRDHRLLEPAPGGAAAAAAELTVVATVRLDGAAASFQIGGAERDVQRDPVFRRLDALRKALDDVDRAHR
jgi:hypothetical protein